jgi:hypothetical protein
MIKNTGARLLAPVFIAWSKSWFFLPVEGKIYHKGHNRLTVTSLFHIRIVSKCRCQLGPGKHGMRRFHHFACFSLERAIKSIALWEWPLCFTYLLSVLHVLVSTSVGWFSLFLESCGFQLLWMLYESRNGS